MSTYSLQKNERDELAALCMKNAQESVFIVNESGVLIEANDSFLKTFGYEEEDLSTLKVWDIDTHISKETWPEIWGQILSETYSNFVTCHIGKDGTEIPVRVYKCVVAYKDRKYVFSCSKPILETEKDALIPPLFEERYQTFMKNIQGIAYETTGDWVPVFFKGQVEEITGYTEAEFLAGTPRWDQIIVPDDFRTMKPFEKDLCTVPGTKMEQEYRIIQKNGYLRWIRDRVQSAPNKAGTSLILVGTLVDITRRKEAERELLESRKKYQDLIENLNEVVFTLDLEGKFTYLSPVATTLMGGFGYTIEDLIGKNITDILHPDDITEADANYRASLAGSSENAEYRVLSKSGKIFWILVSARQMIEDGEIIGLQGIFSNITKRKMIEEEIQRKDMENNA